MKIFGHADAASNYGPLWLWWTVVLLNAFAVIWNFGFSTAWVPFAFVNLWIVVYYINSARLYHRARRRGEM